MADAPILHRWVNLSRKISYKTKLFLLDGLLRPRRPYNMLRFGTYYGGWWIPRVDPSEGVAICVGAGLDVSFDLELHRLGYRVYTVDPTPASIEFVHTSVPELTLIPVGIWDSEGEIAFEQDERWNASWICIDSAPRGGSITGRIQTFPVTTVKALSESIGATQIALLKLDIEGAEHRVLRSIINDGLQPAVICVEFDDQRLRKVIDSTKLLGAYGYELIQLENFNFTFVRRVGPPSTG